MELPTLQEEKQEKLEKDKEQHLNHKTNVQGQRSAQNNGNDDNIVDDIADNIGDKKRKASVIAQKRIYECLKDNGTSVLFCFSPERLS